MTLNSNHFFKFAIQLLQAKVQNTSIQRINKPLIIK